MISVEIPNDIAEYKPKLIMGLNGRQVVCVVITAVIIFLDMTYLKPYIGDTLSIFIAAIPAFLAAMFGWRQPYGMPFEKFLKCVFVEAFVAPKTRTYKTTCSMVVPCDKYFEPVPDELLPQEVLECVQYLYEKTGTSPETDNEGTKKGRRSAKKVKKKYVKSKLAML